MSAEENRPVTPEAENAANAPENPQPDELPEEELSEEEILRRAAKRKRLLRWVAVFLLLDIAVALFLTGRVEFGRQQIASVRDAQAKKIDTTQQMTEEEREEALAVALGQAHACVTLRSEPHAQKGLVDIRLGNGKDSPCAVMLQLQRADTGETLLETDVIEPGYYLESARLAVPLSPGEYHCIARCLFYTMDDNAYLGTTARQVLLSVL